MEQKNLPPKFALAEFRIVDGVEYIATTDNDTPLFVSLRYDSTSQGRNMKFFWGTSKSRSDLFGYFCTFYERLVGECYVNQVGSFVIASDTGVLYDRLLESVYQSRLEDILKGIKIPDDFQTLLFGFPNVAFGIGFNKAILGSSLLNSYIWPSEKTLYVVATTDISNPLSSLIHLTGVEECPPRGDIEAVLRSIYNGF